MPNMERGYIQPFEDRIRGTPARSGIDILRILVSNRQLVENTPTRRNITQEFFQVLVTVMDRLPTPEQLEGYQKATFSPFRMFMKTDERILNGDFNFGRDIEAFFVAYSSLYLAMGIPLEILAERLEHEFDHAAVLFHHSIPIEFHLYLARNRETGQLGDAVKIRTRFPENIPIAKRLEIMREAAISPRRPSPMDLDLAKHGR